MSNMKRKRAYRMEARAQAVEETRERILDAAYRLLLQHPYDDVSLEQVALHAGVSKQTVLRQFDSKDQLAYAVVDHQRPREEASRTMKTGDIEAAVAIVVDRYEVMGDANVRVMELEQRVPAIRYLLEQGRESHRLWIEKVFAPFLPKRKGAAHRRRVMAFYAATEVMLWKLLRRDFGMSRAETEGVLRELVAGLVERSQREES
jgi:AcrR family transcriptional regulator